MTKKQLKLKKEAVEPKIDKKKMDKFDDERTAYEVTIRNLRESEKLGIEACMEGLECVVNMEYRIKELKFDRNIFIASTIIFAVLFLISIL